MLDNFYVFLENTTLFISENNRYKYSTIMIYFQEEQKYRRERLTWVGFITKDDNVLSLQVPS
jgi:hypothetical protein